MTTHEAAKEVVIAAPIEGLYGVIVDYERYPEFVPGMKSCRVRTVGGEKHVDYELDLGLKTVRYTLRMTERAPTHVSWSLVKGDMMRVSNGSWDLAAEGGRTRARYSVEVQIAKPPLVPQGVVDRISDEMSRLSLPRNLEAFRKRAESLASG